MSHVKIASTLASHGTDKRFYARRFGLIPKNFICLWDFLCCVLIELIIEEILNMLGKYSMTVSVV